MFTMSDSFNNMLLLLSSENKQKTIQQVSNNDFLFNTNLKLV